MDRDLEEMEDLESEDRELVDRSKVSRILGMEIPAIGLDSKASFERLMRALDDRRNRQRRRRLALAWSFGAAAVIIGLMAILRLLHR
jgi:hypothetical protein